VAHVGYVNNRVTRRIDVDPVREPLAAKVFELYASGGYSLKTLTRKAYEIGPSDTRVATGAWPRARSTACSEIRSTRETSYGSDDDAKDHTTR